MSRKHCRIQIRYNGLDGCSGMDTMDYHPFPGMFSRVWGCLSSEEAPGEELPAEGADCYSSEPLPRQKPIF